MSQVRHITLEQDGLVLLDEAMRIALTRLVDTEVLSLYRIPEFRDALVATMVPAIVRGEKDAWRLARRGIFQSSLVLAEERASELDSVSTAGA